MSYAGESVISCAADGIPRAALDALHRDYDILHRIDGHLHIRIASDAERAAVEALVRSACAYVYNLEEAVASFEEELTTSRRLLAANRTRTRHRDDVDWFAAYHPLRDIVRWYKDLHAAYPSLTKFVNSVGKSVEGRRIPAFHVTAPIADGEQRRKVWIQCQIHAREWISAPTCMYLVHRLVTSYGRDPETTALLHRAELIVIPIVNPDGYVYTWTHSRLWRKNRSAEQRGCIGTDLNRNYDDHWRTGYGTSRNPCAQTYRGTAPASEPEIAATTAYFRKHAPIYGALDLHNYGQLLLSPLGYTADRAPDRDAFVDLMDHMETSIRRVHGTQYTSQTAFDFYRTSATALDWFYGEDLRTTNGGVRAYSLTLELRDTTKKGSWKFELPADQIRPTAEEIFPSIMIFMKTAIEAPLSY